MLTEEENEEEEEEVDVAPDILFLQKPRSAHVSVHNFTLCVCIYIFAAHKQGIRCALCISLPDRR